MYFLGYTLKSTDIDGTVIFEPLDFIGRLAALIPPPRLNLTRVYEVFAPNSPYRASITPARRGSRWQACQAGAGTRPHSPRARSSDAMGATDQACVSSRRGDLPKCGGTVKVIASIEDPLIIELILRHLAGKDLHELWPESRAPPAQQATLFH